MTPPRTKATKATRGSARATPFPRSPTAAQSWAELAEDEFLILSEKRRNVYVQFNAQGSFGILAEAISNEYLDKTEQLKPAAIARLRKIGWLPPRRTALDVQLVRGKGSPNFTIETDRPVPYVRLADAAVRTLRQVYGTAHPGELEYKAFQSRDDYAIRFPGLGLMRRSER
jgi:hypothetical protein